MRLRIRNLATFLACLVWMAAGLVLLVVLAPTVVKPGSDQLVFAVACASLGLVLSTVVFEFRTDGQRLLVSPDAGFLVLAAVVLPAPLAASAGAIATLWSIRRAGTVLERAFLATGGAVATGAAAVASHGVVSGVPAGRSVLLAVVAAATVRAMVLMTGRLLLAESRTSGGAGAVLRGMPIRTILAFEAGLPIAAVSVAGPFLDDPLLALLVVFAGQLLTWRVLGIQQEQHRGRRVTDELLTTFRRYVPGHVAEQVLARHGDRVDAQLNGEQREVTVMFVDIRGFTAWSERTAPGEVLEELNRLLGDLADAILATDGTIDKFTGDGLMAFWNAPVDQADHAALATQAIPKLLMRVREFNLRREARRATPFEIGIGVASGPAVVGNVGHRHRLSYTALGDTVNLAARLEQVTRERGVSVLVDEGTFLALPAQMQRQLTRLDSLEVKGRTERVRPYAPTTLLHHRDGRGAA